MPVLEALNERRRNTRAGASISLGLSGREAWLSLSLLVVAFEFRA